jgi:hypothetical protein
MMKKGQTTMRSLLLLLLLSGCDGALAGGDPGACPGVEVDGYVQCAPAAEEGCICGRQMPPGSPQALSGGCYASPGKSASCCEGCWDRDTARCLPGDGSEGRYGSHGASCSLEPRR